MRILLALMFFAPVIATIAVKSGVDHILPLMIALSLLAIAAQTVIEFRQDQ